MELYLRQWINLTLICVLYCGSSLSSSHRQKRYLHFPDKSSFVITLTLRRVTAVDFPVLSTLHELDFGFRLPQHPEEIFYKKKYKAKHRERREIHQSILHVTQMFSQGSACCLSELVHSPPHQEIGEEDLLSDVLNIVLDFIKPVVPQSDSCRNTSTSCPMTCQQRGDVSAFLHRHLHLVHSFYTL